MKCNGFLDQHLVIFLRWFRRLRTWPELGIARLSACGACCSSSRCRRRVRGGRRWRCRSCHLLTFLFERAHQGFCPDVTIGICPCAFKNHGADLARRKPIEIWRDFSHRSSSLGLFKEVIRFTSGEPLWDTIYWSNHTFLRGARERWQPALRSLPGYIPYYGAFSYSFRRWSREPAISLPSLSRIILGT